MNVLTVNNQADIIEAFNSTSRYLDDLLSIINPYFEQMVGQIYPTELQLNKANSSDTEAPFLDLNLSITNGIVSSKIYDKRDDFNFEIVNFPFLDGDVPRSPSYGVYISQLIRFARVCSNVDDFNNRNLFLTAKLLKQGYRYHKIRKAFSKFYYRHSELIVKYNIGLKTLLQQGISEPIFYGDLVYKFKRIVRKPNFSDQFKKIVKRYIRVGYNLDIMRQSACLHLNPITVYDYGFLFNCTTVGQAYRNLILTAKLLKQGYRYHQIRKAFSKFYYRHSELIVKYNIELKTLLQQGISEPIFYGDLVYKFKRIVRKPNFSDQFKKIVKRYIRVGYNLDIM